ncbi:DUF2975 domain-containing protein [Streptomyces uncialis]|uniref:DUF2975 domain-containing protein n=1 Tax=Streptomyces uncialis TaxID=1048205 RepID=UPI003864A5B4|nr:DUF2975 domain-containing protein [Streptomyces uncialis]
MPAAVRRAKGTELPDAPLPSGEHPEAGLLQPVATAVRFLYRLALASLAIGAAGLLAGTEPGPLWGGSHLCAEARSTFGADAFTRIFQPHAGVGVTAHPSYCTDHADGAQRLYHFLGSFPSWLLVLGILFLLNRLIRGASREGVFTARTAKHLRVAGWWLLLGCLFAEAVEAAAREALLATLAREHTFTVGSWLGAWQPPYAVVLMALGILTFARIMRAGVAMREDLEGTV